MTPKETASNGSRSISADRPDRHAISSQSSITTCQQAEPAEVWKARGFIREHLADKLSLSEVARAVHINPSYLSEKFKDVTGIKFVDYIARFRFDKACNLLRDVDLSISEIAFEVGFQSLSQFNRVFRKLSGGSPTQYRELAKRRGSKFCRKNA